LVAARPKEAKVRPAGAAAPDRNNGFTRADSGPAPASRQLVKTRLRLHAIPTFRTKARNVPQAGTLRAKMHGKQKEQNLAIERVRSFLSFLFALSLFRAFVQKSRTCRYGPTRKV
jgi:hypothetical protein